MTYLITFAYYGSHLHGDESGSVDRNHNVPGHRVVEVDEARASRERDLMDQAPYLLNAAHVRTNHVHTVVEAEAKPEKVMSDFKSYASRQLNQTEPDGRNRKRWARRGSTRWLWDRDDIAAAIRYVIEDQGEPMAVWMAEP